MQQAVAQIPWGHNIVLLDKITDTEQRRWHAESCPKNDWSRNVLIHQIESGLYERQVLNSKVSNFKQRLPSPQSELATQTMKDPYVFDFIPFRADMLERDIEQALVRDVTKLLLELGTGFAFLENQYHMNVGGGDFYIDYSDSRFIPILPYLLCSTLSLCSKPSFPWYSAFNTPTSFRSVLETYDCSALPLKKQGTMASADFLQFVVTAAFGFSYSPSARPPRVRTTTFLPRNRHIYRTGFGQHWTLYCLAHSSVPVRPTM